MFDINCKHCGEHWDNDCLHEVNEYGGPENLNYQQASKLFALFGCGLFTENPSKCSSKPIASPKQLDQINASMIMSNHPDDWSSI